MKIPELFRLFSNQVERPPHAAVRDARRVISLCHALLSERGEVSGARLASEALAVYQSLEPAARNAFFDLLAAEFSPDPEEVGKSADAYRQEPSQANLVRLQRVVEPPRQEVFRRLNMAPGGTAVLVDMRRRLLQDLGGQSHWVAVVADLTHLLSSWFNRGFLVPQRIHWRTSALVLEKLIQYEGVHEIQGWSDLRRRLQADRRCYGFFHPALPDEPLIFIEVALTRGMSSKVQPLLNPDAPVLDTALADCAIFYSITNCQEGLRGVSFGNFLIKKVVEDLSRTYPRLKTLATLSPIPGFREWLASMAASQRDHPNFEMIAALIAALDEPDWYEAFSAKSQEELLRLCTYYLLHAKHGKEPCDPVARFHLGNGARLERVNWLADTSSTGLRRSAGLMANYVYSLADVERNHEVYAKQYKVVASRQIERMASQSLITTRENPHRKT